MVTVTTGDNVMSPKTVASEDHNNNNGWFDDITEELL
jgi:hypothetical protein